MSSIKSAPDGSRPTACDRLWRNARLATLNPALPGLGLIENGVIAVEDGRIVYAGSEADLPFSIENAAEVIDCGGRWITPGLIDCHTHLVHAGDRANEFEMRLAGASYEEVARAGGGIVSSVRSLREASEDELVRQTLPRLDALMAEGVTTVEIKSGYGLDLENEAKALRAARRLGEERDVAIRTTFLGAHALPPEFKGDKAGYIAKVVDEMLPAIAAEGLADAVDGFCEGIAFSTDEMRLVFDAAKAHRPAGQAACRPALQSARRRPCRRVWRAVGRSSRIYRRSRRRSHGEERHRRRHPARRLLLHPRDEEAADRAVPQGRCCDGDRHRQQSRHLAAHLAASDHEHGGDPVRHDGHRMHRRRDAGGGSRARAASTKWGRSNPENGPISPSGISSDRLNSSTAWASTRCMRASATDIEIGDA